MYKTVPSARTMLVTLTCVLTFLLISTSSADDASHKKQIEEMLVLLQIEQKIAANTEEIKNVYLDQIGKIQVPEAYQAIIDDHQKKAIELIASAVSWENQKELYVNAYLTSLDESAAREINAFLKSSPGRQFLQSQEDVSNAVKDFTTAQMQGLQQQLVQLNQDLQASLKQQQSQQ